MNSERRRFFALMAHDNRVIFVDNLESEWNAHEEFNLSDPNPDNVITILRDHLIDNDLVCLHEAFFYQVYRELTEEEYKKLNTDYKGYA